MKKLVENDLVDRAAEKGKKLSELLESKFSQHPNVGDIRGRGLFQGLEFVEDREAKQPFGSGHKFAARLKANAFEAGLQPTDPGLRIIKSKSSFFLMVYFITF